MREKFNVSIAIMVYVSQKTSSKSEGVVKTWYDPSCMLLVSSRTHYVNNSVSIDYDGDDYPFSVTAKAALGLKLLWEKFPNRNYYGICGDDTMVDIPRLLKKLYYMKISPENPYLLGQTMSHADYNSGKKKSTRVFGGAPIILTREATRWHNKIIQKKGFFSFLICRKKLVNFYKKNGWKILSKNRIKIADYKFSSFGMIFNNNKIYKKYFFNINK